MPSWFFGIPDMGLAVRDLHMPCNSNSHMQEDCPTYKVIGTRTCKGVDTYYHQGKMLFPNCCVLNHIFRCFSQESFVHKPQKKTTSFMASSQAGLQNLQHMEKDIETSDFQQRNPSSPNNIGPSLRRKAYLFPIFSFLVLLGCTKASQGLFV